MKRIRNIVIIVILVLVVVFGGAVGVFYLSLRDSVNSMVETEYRNMEESEWLETWYSSETGYNYETENVETKPTGIEGYETETETEPVNKETKVETEKETKEKLVEGSLQWCLNYLRGKILEVRYDKLDDDNIVDIYKALYKALPDNCGDYGYFAKVSDNLYYLIVDTSKYYEIRIGKKVTVKEYDGEYKDVLAKVIDSDNIQTYDVSCMASYMSTSNYKKVKEYFSQFSKSEVLALIERPGNITYSFVLVNDDKVVECMYDGNVPKLTILDTDFTVAQVKMMEYTGSLDIE